MTLLEPRWRWPLSDTFGSGRLHAKLGIRQPEPSGSVQTTDLEWAETLASSTLRTVPINGGTRLSAPRFAETVLSTVEETGEARCSPNAVRDAVLTTLYRVVTLDAVAVIRQWFSSMPCRGWLRVNIVVIHGLLHAVRSKLCADLPCMIGLSRRAHGRDCHGGRLLPRHVRVLALAL